MRLALSSDAVPDLRLDELLHTCERRGLEALELVEGHAHGVAPGRPPAALSARPGETGAGRVRVAGLVLPPGRLADAPAAARLSAALRAPVVSALRPSGPGELEGIAAAFAAGKGRLLLLAGTDPREMERLRALADAEGGGVVGLAWEVDPPVDDARLVPAVLESAGGRLEYVRLRGGGPEAARQEGLGIGALMGLLALSRYGGPVAIRPSTPLYRQAWRAWLGRAGGWGCGGKTPDGALVVLAGDR